MITTEDLIRADSYRPATIYCARFDGITIPAFTTADLPFTFYSDQHGAIFEPASGGRVRIKQQGVIGHSLQVELQVSTASYVRFSLFSSAPPNDFRLIAFAYPNITNILHQGGGIALMFVPGMVDYMLQITNFSSAAITVFTIELRLAYLGRPDI